MLENYKQFKSGIMYGADMTIHDQTSIKYMYIYYGTCWAFQATFKILVLGVICFA
jgi:hypothetical protein